MLSKNEPRSVRSDQNPGSPPKTPMAVKEKTDGETMEWSAEEEIQLFKALGGLKPIGINKHFYMACICGRLSVALKREICPDVVWAHLHTLYNLEILESMEPLPFPQEQRDFSLPEAEFSELMAKKLQEVEAAHAADGLHDKTDNAGTGDPLVKSRTATPQPGMIKPFVQSRPSSQSSTSSSKSMTTSTSTTAAHNTSTATASSTPSAPTSTTTATGSNSASNVAVSTSTNSATANTTPSLSSASPSGATSVKSFAQRELEKKIAAKLAALETPKRSTKRTRGSMSIESNSPSTTPPPTQNKRRRI